MKRPRLCLVHKGVVVGSCLPPEAVAKAAPTARTKKAKAPEVAAAAPAELLPPFEQNEEQSDPPDHYDSAMESPCFLDSAKSKYVPDQKWSNSTMEDIRARWASMDEKAWDKAVSRSLKRFFNTMEKNHFTAAETDWTDGSVVHVPVVREQAKGTPERC